MCRGVCRVDEATAMERPEASIATDEHALHSAQLSETPLSGGIELQSPHAPGCAVRVLPRYCRRPSNFGQAHELSTHRTPTFAGDPGFASVSISGGGQSLLRQTDYPAQSTTDHQLRSHIRALVLLRHCARQFDLYRAASLSGAVG